MLESRNALLDHSRRAPPCLLPQRPAVSEARKNVGLGLLALIPVACCIGIPLLAAAGVSVAVAAWAGGIALGAIVLVAAAALLGLRLRRRGRPILPHSITRSRS